MSDNQEKIKEFFETKKAEIAQKIEKTPMEKFFLIFLILISISAVVLGYLQFKQNLQSPFYSNYLDIKRTEFKEKYKVTNINSLGQNELLQLQAKDSDLDGLSDYAEIYLYKTSPYLEDSDSDGIWDKQEIADGTDPNCAEGSICNVAGSETSYLNFDGSAEYAVPPANDLAQNLLELESSLLSGNLNLSDLGLDSPELQQLVDQLKNGQTNTNTETIANTNSLNPEDTTAVLESMQNLTPAEIRIELEKLGMDKSVLDSFDDATLQKMLLDTIKTYQ